MKQGSNKMAGSTNGILTMFRQKLNVEVADLDADLIAEGLMDSLMLVDLLSFLEQEYQITIEFEEFEIENFRTIKSIAQFVDSKRSVFSGANP